MCLVHPVACCPIWLDQIAQGGPLTLTEPESRRFFVNVSEATGALLTVPSLPDPAPLFTYNLHESIRMGELAQRLMLATRTVPVAQLGLRPGEKLQEDLLGKDELARPTSCPHISRIDSKNGDPANLLSVLAESCAARNLTAMLSAIRAFVPDYTPSSIIHSEGA